MDSADRPALRERIYATVTHPIFLIVLGVCAGSRVLAMIKTAAGGEFARWDFSHYYVESLALRQGLNPYTTDLRPLGRLLGIEGIEQGSYTPFFLFCFSPLTHLSPRAAFWWWLGLNSLALAVAAVLIVGAKARLGPLNLILLAELALLYPPLSDHFAYAQCQLLILLLIVIAYRCMEQDRERTAGALIALAGLLKVFPLLMVGYLIAERRWRACRWAAGALLTGVLITTVLVGPYRVLSFARAQAFITDSRFVLRPANVAIGSFVDRLWAHWSGLATDGPWHSMGIALKRVVAITLLIATWWAPSGPARDQQSSRARLALWTVTMIELSPTAWIHYLVILYLPMFLIVEDWAANRLYIRPLVLAVCSYLASFGVFLVPLLSGPGRAIAEESGALSLLIAWAAVYSLATFNRQSSTLSTPIAPMKVGASPEALAS